MPSDYIGKTLRQNVIARAGNRCEYCQSPDKYSTQSFVIEHITPKVAGGKSVEENLAYACGGCNAHKYTKQSGFDQILNQNVQIFNPRKGVWIEHFKWSYDLKEVIALSPIGRVTIKELNLNREELMNLRMLLELIGEHPPKTE